MSDQPVRFALEVRYQVAAFALLMERELRANDHKGGWDQEDTSWLLDRLREEVQELCDADPNQARYPYGLDIIRATKERALRVESEAADVANFAMMIADVACDLERPPELDDDRLRAEGAAQRTAAILESLDGLASAEGDPCCASTLRRAYDFIAEAFPPATPSTKETSK